MFDYAGVPNMGYPEFFQRQQGLVTDIIKFSNAIFLKRPVGFVDLLLISKQSRHHLVDDHFLRFLFGLG